MVPRLNAKSTSRTALHHANNASKASRHQPVDQPVDDVDHTIMEIDYASNNNNDADADDEDEDEVAKPKQRRSRTLNSDIRATQLRFYSGTWVDVLIAAKNNYRLFIHNDDPFPERTASSLEDARNCLLDAVGKFKEEIRLPLDDGMLFFSFLTVTC